MEIRQLPPLSLPDRKTSAVGDGDVGQQHPYYRGNRKKTEPEKTPEQEGDPPRLDGSSSHIDIRV